MRRSYIDFTLIVQTSVQQGRARLTRLRNELCSDSFHAVLAWSCGRAKCQCCTATVTVVIYNGQRFLITPWRTMVYTPVFDTLLIFGQSQKAFWLSKISTNLSSSLTYLQSFRQIGLKLWKIEEIQNWYPIVMYYGVMRVKKPRLIWPSYIVNISKMFDFLETFTTSNDNLCL